MFFRQEEKKVTLNDINFSELGVIHNQSHLPSKLNRLISCAVKERNFDSLQEIYSMIKSGYGNQISIDRIISEFFHKAIFQRYNKNDFAKLHALFKIDINQNIYYLIEGSNDDYECVSQSMLLAAVDRKAKDIFEYLVEHNASLQGVDKAYPDLKHELKARMAYPPGKDSPIRPELQKFCDFLDVFIKATHIQDAELNILLDRAKYHLNNDPAQNTPQFQTRRF